MSNDSSSQDGSARERHVYEASIGGPRQCRKTENVENNALAARVLYSKSTLYSLIDLTYLFYIFYCIISLSTFYCTSCIYCLSLHITISFAITMKESHGRGVSKMPASALLEAQLAEGRTIRHQMVRQMARLEDIILVLEEREIPPELYLYYEERHGAAVESLEFADAVIELSRENIRRERDGRALLERNINSETALGFARFYSRLAFDSI